ncbi:protein Gawky-like [Physella acuta]|uniref:protein Gawky-like n=1 Tax=Physella acuta TaxID=109671 RepID=UPI0027DDA22E|nr:protein Gawky-like [Physella acuta]
MEDSIKSGTRSMEARARAKRAASASMRGDLAPNSMTFVNDGKTSHIKRKPNDSDPVDGTAQSDKSTYTKPGSGNGKSFTFSGIKITHDGARAGTFRPGQFTYTTSGNGKSFTNGQNFSGIYTSYSGAGTGTSPSAQFTYTTSGNGTSFNNFGAGTQCVNINVPGMGSIFNNGRNMTVVNNRGSCSIIQTGGKTVIYCDENDTSIYSTGTGNVTVVNSGTKRPSTNQAQSESSAKRTRVDTNGNYWQSDSSEEYSDDWLSMFNLS